MSLALLTLVVATMQGELESPQELEVVGELIGHEDLSAIAWTGRELIVASDETRAFQTLTLDRERGRLLVTGEPYELVDSGSECDFEAMASGPEDLFLTGSHALLRKRLDQDESAGGNRARLGTVEREDNRYRVFTLPRAGASWGPAESWSLEPALAADPILARFLAIPGKENGVDVEGLAWRDDHLWFGLRSPVVRGNLAPVLRVDPATRESETLWLPLDGLGIRSLEAVDDGFLVLAGPPHDKNGRFRLYHWNGSDGVPGSDRAEPVVRELLRLPKEPGRAEGMCVVGSSATHWEILLVHDGSDLGRPLLARVARPD